jgi:IrrE N-terminal-like domain
LSSLTVAASPDHVDLHGSADDHPVFFYMVHSDLVERRQRFDLAHELGHLMLPYGDDSLPMIHTGHNEWIGPPQQVDLTYGVGHLTLQYDGPDTSLDPSTIRFSPAVVATARSNGYRLIDDSVPYEPPGVHEVTFRQDKHKSLSLVNLLHEHLHAWGGGIRLRFGQGTLLGDLWAETRYAYLLLEAALRCLESLECITAGLGPPRRSYTLVLLAVSRRFGRRSEPDDHASLFFRRHLVSAGSCP